ncbi:MAG: hypothetical protein PHE56_12995 [Bacteroidales bacterium]|nr:hypothetical protein [Bacteroidales bacterium]
MNNVTNTQEKLKTAEDQKKKKKLPASNIKKEYDILKHKYLLQENIKKLSLKDKQDLEAEYKDIFGPQFGQLTMTSEEKSKYFELKDEYERLEGRRGIKEIAKIHADLMRAPLPEKFDGFKKQDPNKDSDEPLPSEEQVRIILAALPSELLSVFNQYFTVHFYKTTDKDQLNSLIQEATGGAIVDKYKDASNNNKFRISVDLDSFYTDYQKEIEGIKYTQSKFNKNKFLYTITRAILSTVKDKSEVTEFAKKHAKLAGKKLDKNCETEYDDWLAYYLTNPEKAKNADPEL